jgi:tRNA 2-thiouridine synthesizing protein A
VEEHFIDANGLKCPLPVLKARKALEQMAPGDILTVSATDPAATHDFPEYCRAAGHVIEHLEATVDGEISVRIRKGGD